LTSNNQSSTQIRNSKLFELVKNLTNSLIAALDRPFSEDYGSWYDRVKVVIKGNPELIAKILEKRPDLEEEKLSRCVVNSERCVHYLSEGDFSRKPPHASTSEKRIEELSLFLEKLFKERDRIQQFFSKEGAKRHFEQIFKQEYMRYEKYLYSDEVTDFLLCPLQNFQATKDIELENQLAIREITQDEFHSLIETKGEKYLECESYPEFVLFVPFRTEWVDYIETTLTALRTLKKERVGLNEIYIGYSFPFKPWSPAKAPQETIWDQKQAVERYLMSNSENEKLKNLWKIVDRAKKVGYLRASIRRFNFGHSRERLEDRWVDFFISLESLFSKESESADVSYRLATRISLALENKFDERKLVRKKIKNWYDIRSKIVHGTHTSIDERQLEELEETLRASLLWFMNQNEYSSHDEIIDLLDLAPVELRQK